MKKTSLLIQGIVLASCATLFVSSCKKKSEDTPTPVEEKVEPRTAEYPLVKIDSSLGNGKVVFTEKSSTETIVTIILTGITTGSYPAHIHANSAAETGPITISLNSVDATGKSTTTINKKDDGTPISFSQLVDFDGYLNVHLSGSKLLSQGDIGGNQLTGEKKSYSLTKVGSFDIGGTVELAKRKNNKTLVTVALTNTANNGEYPSAIYTGSTSALLPSKAADLKPVLSSNKSISMTTVRNFSILPVTYDQIMNDTYHVNIYESPTNNTVIVAQANIGKTN